MRRIVLLLSIFIVLLHNFIPHIHHSEEQGEEQYLFSTETPSLIDPLLMIFHEDESGTLDHWIPDSDDVDSGFEVSDFTLPYAWIFRESFLKSGLSIYYSGSTCIPRETSILFFRGPPSEVVA